MYTPSADLIYLKMVDALVKNDNKEIGRLVAVEATDRGMREEEVISAKLVKASEEGNIKLIGVLNELREKISIARLTALMLVAAEEGNLELAKTLHIHGANINGREDEISKEAKASEEPCPTATICAVINGDIPMLRFLLQNGANPSLEDNMGLDALDWAYRERCSAQGRNTVEFLKEEFNIDVMALAQRRS